MHFGRARLRPMPGRARSVRNRAEIRMFLTTYSSGGATAFSPRFNAALTLCVLDDQESCAISQEGATSWNRRRVLPGIGRSLALPQGNFAPYRWISRTLRVGKNLF